MPECLGLDINKANSDHGIRMPKNPSTADPKMRRAVISNPKYDFIEGSDVISIHDTSNTDEHHLEDLDKALAGLPELTARATWLDRLSLRLGLWLLLRSTRDAAVGDSTDRDEATRLAIEQYEKHIDQARLMVSQLHIMR